MTARKGFKAYLMPLIVLLVVCMLLGSLNLGVKASAASDDLEIGVKEDTSYYMHIKTKGVAVYFNDFSALGGSSHPLLGLPTDFDATVIFNFIDVQFESKSFFCSAVVRVTKVMSGSVYNYHFNFSDDVKINIRESFYNKFMKPDSNISKYNLTWYKSSKGYKGYDNGGAFSGGSPIFSMPVTFSTAPTPPGANDPDSDKFEPGDNGGLDTSPIYKAVNGLGVFWVGFYNLLTKFFKWNLTYFEFNVISIAIAVGVVILIILGLIFRRKK